MRKYNKYLAAGLFLSLLSFSTYAVAEEEYSNSSADKVSEYDSNDGEFSATVTERDNDFCIKGGGWSSATFSKITKNDTELYSVTAGQPFSGIDPNKQPVKKTCIRVKSGRKSSQTPMDWAMYKAGLNAVDFNYAYNRIEVDYTANFAFIGTLKLTDKSGTTISCSNVVVGQSNFKKLCAKYPNSTANVWFMSNGSCVNNKTKDAVKLKIKAGDDTKCTSTNNSFEITVSKAQ